MSPRMRKRRAGTVLILTVFLMVVMLGFLALSVDIGYLAVIKTEIQRSADAAAIAAARSLIDETRLAGQTGATPTYPNTKSTAIQYAALNKVGCAAPNVLSGDVTLGHLSYPFGPSSAMTYADPTTYNAVRVDIQQTAARNQAISLFFANALGINTSDSNGQATAAFSANIKGFKTPGDGGETLGILPFALDKQTWDGLVAGGGSDSYTYNELTGTVSCGGDGVREVNLYPQGTGSPGNRGTVDIGSSNNSTADIARQIVYGISPADMAALGKPLALDASGQLTLNGDTGISAGVKDELASIKGQPRVIPIFQSVSGPGNNATYTIVQFAGVRIMYVKLTGSASSKQVIIQPARAVMKNVIPATDGGTYSYGVYSGVWLVK